MIQFKWIRNVGYVSSGVMRDWLHKRKVLWYLIRIRMHTWNCADSIANAWISGRGRHHFSVGSATSYKMMSLVQIEMSRLFETKLPGFTNSKIHRIQMFASVNRACEYNAANVFTQSCEDNSARCVGTPSGAGDVVIFRQLSSFPDL